MRKRKMLLPAQEAGKKVIHFHYIKSPAYRSLYMDGAYGGLTPSGQLHMALYSERVAIPTQTGQAIEDGALGSDVPEERQSKDGIVREIEASVFLTLETAEALKVWLDDKIQRMKALSDEADEDA